MVLRSFSFGLAALLFLALGFLQGLQVATLINLQAMVIVFGGMALVLTMGFSRDRVSATWRSIRRLFRGDYHSEAERRRLLKEIFRLANLYRLHGPLALERGLKEVEHPFLRYGAMFVAEGYDRWALTHALERELRAREARMRSQVELLRTLMRLAPSLGMAGTVVSLMQVMGRLETMASASSALAVALSSTLYGVLTANLLLLPIAAKLEQRAQEEHETDAMVVEALLAMEATEHPMRIAERFNAYDLYQEYRQGAAAPEMKGSLKPVEA